MKPKRFGLSECALLLAVITLFAGCSLFGDGDTMVCGKLQTITLSKKLTPNDPDFILSTGEGTAFLNKSCQVEFDLGFGFYNDSLQAKAYVANNPLQMPLKGLQAENLFHVDNDSLILKGGWKTVASIYNFADTNSKHFFLTVNDYGQHTDMNASGYGTYYIKTGLLSSVLSADSSVWVSGRIVYYDGGPL